jgi:hypothetical protein
MWSRNSTVTSRLRFLGRDRARGNDESATRRGPQPDTGLTGAPGPSKPVSTDRGAVHDRPSLLDENDAFSHRDYAIAAADTLLAADASFTLGLFGDWGIGKTTIVKEIGEILRAKDVGFVEFDVWRFEGDALRRQFLREAANQLKLQSHLPWHYKPERELRDLEVDIPIVTDRLRFSWWALLRALLVGAGLGLLAWLYLRSSLPGKMFGRKTSASTAQEVSLLLSAGAFLFSLLSQILLVEQRTVTTQRIEEPERFYAKFVELLQKAKGGRIVIAIDNLDRCSPGLVDTMLATIKTYLEPALEASAAQPQTLRDKLREFSSGAKSKTDAVFVIAADDAGVRRHMVGRELQKLPKIQMNQTSEKDALAEAERVVDEYLRKFFDSSIRLRPLISEDIRKYARLELERFLDYARNVERAQPSANGSEAVEERLVSLVVSALRSNPRRIKQFANSLETRVRTIRAREASGGISKTQGVSDDLLGIAKLAILEEEWSWFYEELETNPRRLAQAQQEVGVADMADARLSTFLRDTRDIVPVNVAAIVNLKLESVELGLPEFAAYRDAVSYGDVSEASRIVQEADSSLAAQYARRLPDLFARELRNRGISEARNVLGAALQPTPLGLGTSPAVGHMLADAANDPSLAEQLPLLPASAVFAALSGLSLDDRLKARAPFIDLARVGDQLGTSGVHEAATELARVLDDLSPSERRNLEGPLQVEPAASQYRASYMPLFTTDPRLISDVVLQSSWQSLNARFDVTAPEFDIMTLGFSVDRGNALIPDFLGQLIATFVNAVPVEAEHAAIFKGVLTALERLVGLPNIELEPLISAVATHVPSLVGGGAETTTQFALEVAVIARRPDHATSETHAAGDQLVSIICQSAPLQVAAHLSAGDIPMDTGTRDLAAQQLEAILPNYSDPEQRVALLRGIMRASNGQQRVKVLLESYFEPTSIASLRPILVALWPDLGQEGAVLVSELYEFGRDADFSTNRTAIEAIIALIALGDMRQAEYLAARWEELYTGRRSSLRAALVELLDNDLSMLEAVGTIAESVNLRAVDREPLVRAFLRAARNSRSSSERARALEIAKTLASPSKPARKLVAETISALEENGRPSDELRD